MNILKEFKQFAMRGNVVDMAVGVVIGGAFGKIVTSLLNDVLMPPLGLLTGGMDFTDLSLTLKAGVDGSKPVTLNYGAFITVVVDFILVAIAVFSMVKLMNSLKKADAPPPAPSVKECPHCLLSVPLAAKKCGHCTSVLA